MFTISTHKNGIFVSLIFCLLVVFSQTMVAVDRIPITVAPHHPLTATTTFLLDHRPLLVVVAVVDEMKVHPEFPSW